LLWQNDFKSKIYGSLFLDSTFQTIYLGAEDGGLRAISVNGSEKWRADIKHPIYTSPVVDRYGMIYVSAGGKLYAFDADGNMIWDMRLDGESGRRAHIAVNPAGTLYLGLDTGRIIAIDTNARKKLWSTNLSGDLSQASPALSHDSKIVVLGADGIMHKLDPEGNVLWQAQVSTVQQSSHIFSSPVIAPNGTIYVGSVTRAQGRFLDALSAFNIHGELKWKYRLSGTPSTPAIAQDGTVYVADFKGFLHAINPDGTSQWINPYGQILDTLCSPSIGADGTIYVCGGEGFLQSYASKSPPAASWSALGGMAR